MSAAIELQRDAADNFAATARETSAATSDVVGRMIGISSQILRREIHDIVRKAINGGLREFPRYEVKLTARLERNEEVDVLDIGEGGARIDIVENVAIDDHVVLTFPGMEAIAAEAVRSGGDGFVIYFKPACLRFEGLRNLVTSEERVA